jgi:RES domain-containing protein
MSKRRRKALPNIIQKKLGSNDEMPSLLELERFSQANLRQWTAAGAALQALYAALYFELEPKRQKDGHKLLDAIRSRATQDFQFENWSRVVNYQYSNEPLSTLGSTRGIGGRFNFGEEISPGTFTSFPSLYLAEDAETALREKFGVPPAKGASLSVLELALRSPSSFTQVRLHGRLDLVLDVGELSALEPFVKVIREYPMPKAVLVAARNLAMRRPPWLIRSPIVLQRQLLHTDWRAWPMQFSVPSNSQIFGRIAAASGVHGILYPSARNSAKRCLALFPRNWKGSSTYVALSDKSPPGVTKVRLDGGKAIVH